MVAHQNTVEKNPSKISWGTHPTDTYWNGTHPRDAYTEGGPLKNLPNRKKIPYHKVVATTPKRKAYAIPSKNPIFVSQPKKD